jgi:hypothetical protein
MLHSVVYSFEIPDDRKIHVQPVGRPVYFDPLSAWDMGKEDFLYGEYG